MIKEKTICKSISIEGIGLQTGEWGKISMHPLPSGSGIIFRNIDSKKEVKASIENVVDTKRGVTLKKDEAIVRTPEHLLSALYVMGVSNLLIEYKGEIPILDGSARPYIDFIEKAGIVEQEKERRVCRIESPIFIREKDKLLVALPSDQFRIRYLIDYPDTYIESEYYDFPFDPEIYINDISKAKTFGFYEEIESLYRNRLSLGGSLENAIVVDKRRVLGKLSVEREFVKHKIIDFLGDISLINSFLYGDFILIKTGHSMHIQLARMLTITGGCYA